EDNPDRAVFVRQGLLAGAQVDDAQAPVREKRMRVGVQAGLVRTAVRHHVSHLDGTLACALIELSGRDDSGYAAHTGPLRSEQAKCHGRCEKLPGLFATAAVFRPRKERQHRRVEESYHSRARRTADASVRRRPAATAAGCGPGGRIGVPRRCGGQTAPESTRAAGSPPTTACRQTTRAAGRGTILPVVWRSPAWGGPGCRRAAAWPPPLSGCAFGGPP